MRKILKCRFILAALIMCLFVSLIVLTACGTGTDTDGEKSIIGSTIEGFGDAHGLFLGNKDEKRLLYMIMPDGEAREVEFTPEGGGAPIKQDWQSTDITFCISNEFTFLGYGQGIDGYIEPKLAIENKTGKVFDFGNDGNKTFYMDSDGILSDSNTKSYISFSISDGNFVVTVKEINSASRVMTDVYGNFYSYNEYLSGKIDGVVYHNFQYFEMYKGSDGRVYHTSGKVYDQNGNLTDMSIDENTHVFLKSYYSSGGSYLIKGEDMIHQFSGSLRVSKFNGTGFVNPVDYVKEEGERITVFGNKFVVVSASKIEEISWDAVNEDFVKTPFSNVGEVVVKGGNITAIKTFENNAWVETSYYTYGNALLKLKADLFDGEIEKIAMFYTYGEVTDGGNETPANNLSNIAEALEAKGYVVNETSQTVLEISVGVLAGVKGSDMITVVWLPTEELAIQAKPDYDTMASALGQTCKRDGNVVYYGTSAALADYESIG